MPWSIAGGSSAGGSDGQSSASGTVLAHGARAAGPSRLGDAMATHGMAPATPADAQKRITETLDLLERYRQARLSVGDTEAADDADRAQQLVLGGTW